MVFFQNLNAFSLLNRGLLEVPFHRVLFEVLILRMAPIGPLKHLFLIKPPKVDLPPATDRDTNHCNVSG